MKKISIMLLALLMGMFAFNASSHAFSLGGYVGDIVIQFQNYDVGTLYGAPSSGSNVADGNADSFGIMTVLTISDTSSNLLWAQSAGEALEGWFYGLDDKAYNFNAFGVGTIDSIGGKFELYLGTRNLNIVGGNPPTMPQTGLSAPTDLWNVTDGTLFLSADFSPGVNLLDPTITYHQDITNITSPVSGSGSGYLSITGGSHGYLFDTDAALGGSDMYMQNGFNAGGLEPEQSQMGWTVKSAGTAEGGVVPEPASMAIFGIGALGLGALRRKRKIRA